MKNLSLPHTFDQDSLISMRRIVETALLLGVVLCILVTGATAFVLSRIGVGSVLWIGSALVATLACHFSRSRKALSLFGSLGAICTAGGLGVLAQYANDPSRWLLSDGLVITMVLAFLCHGLVEYLFAAVSIWSILLLIIPSNLYTAIDKLYFAMTLSGSLLLGAIVAILFYVVRRDNYLLREKLKQLALYDVLTGLPNRRCFLDQIESAEMQAARPGDDFFFMVDIDNFKRINDDFGHDVGDEALKKVAAVIGQTSEHHICARLGGEEFAIFGSFEEAAALSLAAHINARVFTCSINERQITVSIGVARRGEGEHYNELMKRADQSLYIAKSSGKNKYHYDIPTEP